MIYHWMHKGRNGRVWKDTRSWSRAFCLCCSTLHSLCLRIDINDDLSASATICSRSSEPRSLSRPKCPHAFIQLSIHNLYLSASSRINFWLLAFWRTLFARQSILPHQYQARSVVGTIGSPSSNICYPTLVADDPTGDNI